MSNVWKDDVAMPGTDVDIVALHDNLMHLKYDNAGGAIGLTGYIADGLKITPGTGLNAVVSAGRASIGEKAVSFIDQGLTLSPRMASLVYGKSDKTVGKVDAQLPAASTQTLRYILDGSTPIVNTGTGSVNAATKTGTVAAADGRIGYSGKGDGIGYYTCASNVGVPAYTSASTRILVIDNFVSNGAVQTFYSDGITSFGCTAVNNLTVNGVDTSFTLTTGNAYVIALPADASTTTAIVYVDGISVNTSNYIANATAVAPTFYSGAGGANKSVCQLAYFECYATKLTPAQIGAISNGLLFPCQDIRNILPINSIALGYVKTNSSAVIEIDTSSYKYGRHEGAIGGNRVMVREWKYVTTGITKDFDNHFKTENVQVSEIWFKKNLADSKHSVIDMTSSSADYGVYAKNVDAFKIILAVGGGAILSAWNSYTTYTETSGYIALGKVEVIE